MFQNTYNTSNEKKSNVFVHENYKLSAARKNLFFKTINLRKMNKDLAHHGQWSCTFSFAASSAKTSFHCAEIFKE